MRKRRFLETLTAALLAVLLISSDSALAKGKPGGGGDPPTNLPNVRYELTRIPLGLDQIVLRGTNSSGTVVGFQYTAPGPRAFIYMYDAVANTETLYSQGDLDMLAALYHWPVPAGSQILSLQDVNEFGLVVGTMGNSEGNPRTAIALDTGLSHDPADWIFSVLPKLGSPELYAREINDLGDILVMFDLPDGTVDHYLYNYYAPAANEPLQLNMVGSTSKGLNNARQVLFSTAGIPVLFEEGSGLTIFTDADYREPGGVGRHFLNDAGQFAWSAWVPTKGNRGNTVPVRHGIQPGLSVEILKSATSSPNGINQQGDTIIDDSSTSSLFHNDAELLTIEDLIPDTDPLKAFWVGNISEVNLLTDRSSESNDPEYLRYPTLVGRVSTSAGYAAIVFTPIPSP